MRILKLLFGLTLTLGSLGYYLHYLVSMHSDYAVVAAQRQSISSPANGLLTHNLSFGGSVVDRHAILASVTPDADVDADLKKVGSEILALQAEATYLESLVGSENRLAGHQQTRTAALHRVRLTQLKETGLRAQSEYKLRETELASAKDTLSKSEALCVVGLKPELECQKLRLDSEVVARRLDIALSEVRLAGQALKASEQGSDFEAQGSSQLVYREQVDNQLALRMADLQKEVELRQARVTALRATIASAPVELSAPSKVMVWSVLRPTSTLIGRGEPILDVTNCTELFVYAELPASKYERIELGVEATVEVLGKAHPGRVVRLLGPVTSVEQGSDILPRPPRRIVNADEDDKGAVLIASASLAGALARTCSIGATANVKFGGPGRLRGLWPF